jgi:hypothetical protein
LLRGLKRKKRVDFFDTYAPISKITIIRLIVTLTSFYKLEIHRININFFLNGDLEEKIYVYQLKGFVALGQEKKIHKLVKCLYGLKQASKY